MTSKVTRESAKSRTLVRILQHQSDMINLSSHDNSNLMDKKIHIISTIDKVAICKFRKNIKYFNISIFY